MFHIKFDHVDYRHILNDISLELSQGDFAILIGHNGAGKTTLLKLILGELKATSGQIIKPPHIAIVHQNIEDNLFLDLTVEENLKLYGINNSSSLSYLQRFNKALTLDKIVKHLSGGERQALSLALRLYHKPDVLLLDEVTSALDEEAAHRLLNLIYEKTRDIITIMITHDIDEVKKYKPKILKLEKGRLV